MCAALVAQPRADHPRRCPTASAARRAPSATRPTSPGSARPRRRAAPPRSAETPRPRRTMHGCTPPPPKPSSGPTCGAVPAAPGSLPPCWDPPPACIAVVVLGHSVTTALEPSTPQRGCCLLNGDRPDHPVATRLWVRHVCALATPSPPPPPLLCFLSREERKTI